MINNIEKVLEEIGLTKGEIQVYLALVKLDISTTGQIAKQSKISNSKVYEVLGRLIQKGLASYVLKNNIRNYRATPPERLVDFLDNKKEQIEKNKLELEKIIPLIKSVKKQDENSVTVYEGKQGIKVIINDIIEAQENGIELLTFGSDENVFAEKYPDLVSHYAMAAKKKKLRSRAIFSRETKPFNKTENQKYLPRGMISPVRIAIYNDKVAIFKFSDPVSVVLIEEKTIASGYKNQFEYLWKIAKN
ncbi:hypothetical protein GF386_01770 [Candidatus Pacearchaeota archaeon]|nr:hypothetical protein [Candidatus Pacearchaeota archaeon]MBD3282908.1 hypothetical protein [Candidatus Pacearchaeota archaeon]